MNFKKGKQIHCGAACILTDGDMLLRGWLERTMEIQNRKKFSLAFEKRTVPAFVTTIDAVDRRSWKTERHSHRDYEVHIVLKGSCRVAIGNQSLFIKEGQALLIPPNTFHSAQSQGPEFLRFSVSLELDDSWELTAEGCVFASSDEIASICQSFYTELDSGRVMTEFVQNGLLLQLFVLLYRKLQMPRPGQTAKNENRTRSILIDEFFNARNGFHGSKADLARQINVSERHLERILLSLYGMPFCKKMCWAKMDYAAHQLRTTDRKLRDIQSAVGYDSTAAFYKAFESVYAVPPGVYRKLHRQRESGR